MRRHLSYALLALTTALLALGTLTPMFAQPLAHLSPHAHLLLHAAAHAVLVLALSAAAPAVRRETVCTMSVGLAVLLELAQMIITTSRRGHLADIMAASMGSLVLLALPRDAKLVLPLPRCAALADCLWPRRGGDGADDDDDDDDDGGGGGGGDDHRVASWAV